MLKRQPPAINQDFQWLEAGFVIHFVMLFYPVAEIKIFEAQGAAKLNLPKDVIGAETGLTDIRIVESVDRRYPCWQEIDDADHTQVFPFMKSDQTGIDMALQQKILILSVVVLRHAVVSMASGLIVLIEFEMLPVKMQFVLTGR